MPPAPTAERLAAGITVVTATRRLARDLTRAFDARQAAAGRRAWESADVLPWHAFVARTWRRIAGDCGRELLLNEWQLAAVWEAVIADDIRANERDEAALWNTHATARGAAQAWATIHDWRIELSACAAAANRTKHRDHLCWIRWARAFDARCRARNWTDSHRLARQLGARLTAADDLPPDALPQAIQFSGFDHLTPQQDAVVDALRGAGVEVTVDAVAADSAAAPCHLSSVVCPDESAQWLAAAAWARAQLEANPGARIAIVAPNIGRAAPGIEAALRQILCPRQLLQPDAPAAELPYHISLGAPLGRHPVARDALAALAAFGGRALPVEEVGGLIRSPFIAPAFDEADARCKLDLACRRYLPHEIRFARLVEQLTDERGLQAAADCPKLSAALAQAQALAESEPSRARQAASHWAMRFDEFLKCLGWPGEGLGSDEFQAAQALRRALQNLATLDLATAPMRAADALAWLRRRALEQAFQPEAHAAPVQVLGVFEAAGQRFDALWFGDLTADEWPPQPRPNPFIDLELQRAAGAPGSCAQSARAQTETTHRRILASAEAAVLSHPAVVDEDVAAEASVLFGDDAAADDAAALRDVTPARLICAAGPDLESAADNQAPKLPAAVAGGGIAVIENQAKCPFRAFALHRLHAREAEANEQGLDAGERGALVHRALQLVWETIQSSAKLAQLTDAKRRKIIDAAVAEAAKQSAAMSGCGARFQKVQARWLADTLREWLEVEEERAAFTVAGLEQETSVSVGDLTLACKIDRVDQLASGDTALIDYKTGTANSLRNWAGARPQSPQLPLYAIAGDATGAVAFAQVKRGECKFSGVARGDFGPGVGAVESSRALKGEFADWAALLAHWRRALPVLAAEFVAGEARVDPHQPSVCAQCNLHTLCRIDADSGAW